MSNFPFSLTDAIGTQATLGLIVLKYDETLEQDMRRLFPSRDVAVYVSRIQSSDEVTPNTLGAMEVTMPEAAGLLPPAAPFDVVGYGCTSGTTMIGADKVAALVRQGISTSHVCDPLSAALAACAALKIKRLGMVTPYIESVSGPVRQAFETAGFAVPHIVSFGESGEERVARIDGASIKAAALKVGRAKDVDAVFLSCTNLRTLDVIADIEAELGKPVLSSNQALAWHMATLSGAPLAADASGRIFQL